MNKQLLSKYYPELAHRLETQEAIKELQKSHGEIADKVNKLAIVKETSDDTKVEKIAMKLAAKLATLEKGDKGDSFYGSQGIQGEKGEQGIPGEKGEQGIQGIQGQEGKRGIPGIDGRDGRDGINGKDGKDGKDGLRENLNEYVKRDDLKELTNTLLPKGKIDQRWHGGGLSKVSTDSTLSGTGTPSSPLSVIGGGGLNAYTLTDTGDHQNFTISSTPATTNYIVPIAGAMYFYDDAQFGYTVVGTTLTFTTALDSTTAALVTRLLCY